MSSKFFSQSVARFRTDRRGNVAMMFGLALVPMMGMAGGVVDYAVASQTHTQLQAALDGTALAIAHDASGLTGAQAQAQATARFAAIYEATAGKTAPALTTTIAGRTVTVRAQTEVPTSFLGILGIKSWPVTASSSSAFNDKQLEIALVLDNTGSMRDNNKMVELKKAVNNLLDKLDRQSTRTGAVKVSIVPFNTQVQVGTSYRSASWLRFGTAIDNSYLKYVLGVVPATAGNWTGCVTDRDQPYDTQADAASAGQSAYVAFKCVYAGLSKMMTLTDDLDAVRSTANAMTPTGATNVTVGFTMGLATLQPSSPFGQSSSATPGTAKFLILLTDGNNTQNRWGGDGSDGNAYAYDIDQRLRTACTTARASQGVHVFTIRVMDGNANLLRDCATDSTSYYDVKSADQLQPVFDNILSTINGIRLAS